MDFGRTDLARLQRQGRLVSSPASAAPHHPVLGRRWLAGVAPLALASAVSSASAAGAAAAAPGTVALWEMDELSGTSMLDSVGSHTGTLHSVQLGRPGFSGTAYGFGGAGWVSVP